MSQQPQSYPQQQQAAVPVQYGSQPQYTQQPVYVQQGVPVGAPQPIYVQQQQMVGVVVAPRMLGKFPAGPMTCPFCQATITTSVTTTPGCFVWSVAALLCFIGAWPCCLIPFCMPNCHDSLHSCPNCRATLAVEPGSC